MSNKDTMVKHEEINDGMKIEVKAPVRTENAKKLSYEEVLGKFATVSNDDALMVLNRLDKQGVLGDRNAVEVELKRRGYFVG